MIHGFFGMAPDIDAAVAAQARVAAVPAGAGVLDSMRAHKTPPDISCHFDIAARTPTRTPLHLAQLARNADQQHRRLLR